MRNIFMLTLALALGAMVNAQKTPTDVQHAGLQNPLREMNDAKPKFGVKAGYNVARITGSTPNFSPEAKNGFMVSAFYSPAAKSGLGYRTELVFTRQGFGFDESGKQTTVSSDYIYMPHFTTFGIGKFFQIHVGGQLGYLLKSSKETLSEGSQDITSFANRLDYGAAGGVEIYPVKHLIVGGRYNVSFGNAYKRMATQADNPTPSPLPLPFNPDEVKGKNAVMNFYIGFRF